MKVKTFKNATVGSMATFPGRFTLIAPVIESLAPQLDHLFIYVNETTDGFPDVSHLKNVTVLDGRDYMGDLSANGKVYPIKFLTDCVVLTLDDDFIFPPDYVATYVALLDKFNGKCAVTTHGSIFPPKVDWYYERTHVMMSIREQSALKICSLAGSGTFCFDQKTLKCDPDSFFSEIMVDLRFSVLAREQGLPIWVVPRPEGWLHHIKSEGLWDLFSVGALTHHTDFARDFDWSFEVYRTIANTAIATAGLDPEDLGLDTELLNGLRTGLAPTDWDIGRIAMMKRVDYMNILLQP